MSDQELRNAKREWLSAPEDDGRLARFLQALVRSGEDVVRGLARARPDAAWAGFLASSVPVFHPPQTPNHREPGLSD